MLAIQDLSQNKPRLKHLLNIYHKNQVPLMCLVVLFLPSKSVSFATSEKS